MEIIGVFPFMLSLVEAFIGFFSRIKVSSLELVNTSHDPFNPISEILLFCHLRGY